MSGIRSDGGFEGMLATMRDLAANGLPMTTAAANVDAFMRGQLAKGQTPDGKTWTPTKKGTKPLKGAPSAYMQSVVGRSIVMKVLGRYAFHHFGAGDNPAREQLPTGTMPKELGNAIRAGLVDDFKAKTKAGKIGYRKFRAAGGKITRGAK
jgi:hypothetical protein